MHKKTMRQWIGSVLLAPGMLLAALSATAQAPPVNGLTSKVTTASPHVKHGGSAALSVRLTDKTLNVPNAVVDLEVYNAQNKRVAQNIWQGQKLVKGKSNAYHWTWKPTTPGAYTVKLGVFGSTWKPLYHWSDKALALTVA